MININMYTRKFCSRCTNVKVDTDNNGLECGAIGAILAVDGGVVVDILDISRCLNGNLYEERIPTGA